MKSIEARKEMESSEEKSPEHILRDELIKAEESGKAIASHGREITQAGQSIIDLAKATRDIVECAPGLIDIESQIDLWQHSNTYAETFLHVLEDSKESMVLTSGTVDTTSASILISVASAERVIPNLPPEKRELAQTAIKNFSMVVSRPAFKEEVLTLLDRWGFDRATLDRMSAKELYLTAYNAFERPVSDANPVTTSLIPMRECIETVVSELLRLRPRQEKAPKNYDKIISIGSQLKRDGLSEDVIMEWARQYDTLVKDLSRAKQGQFTRPEWGRRLQQATLFLDGLLKGLDPTKI